MVPIKELLRWGEDDIVRNTVELDMMSDPGDHQKFSSNPQLPISKHVLSTIIKHVLSESKSKHVYVENEKEDHFLYGLVLPLLARILCSSCPGLLCIVELPALQDGGTGKTGELKDEAEKTQQSKALRLLSNGFEVLTSRLPPRSDGTNDFTLTTVGWVQAGVVSPQRGVALPLTFSNGLEVESEGIAVTFTNGSMCQLTIQDPWKSLESLKLPFEFPVALFAFNYGSGGGFNGSQSKSQSSQGSHGRARDQSKNKLPDLSGRNVLYVEVGHFKEQTRRAPPSMPLTTPYRAGTKPKRGSHYQHEAEDVPMHARSRLNSSEHSQHVAVPSNGNEEGYEMDPTMYHMGAEDLAAERDFRRRKKGEKEMESHPPSHGPHVINQHMNVGLHGSMAHPHAHMYPAGRMYHYPGMHTMAPMQHTNPMQMNNMVPLFVNQGGYRSPVNPAVPNAYQKSIHVQLGHRQQAVHGTVAPMTNGHYVNHGAREGIHSNIPNGVEESTGGALEALVQMKYGRSNSELSSSNSAGSGERREQ